MNHTPIYLSRTDYLKLRRLLATSLHSHAGTTLRKLGEELDRAAVIDPAAVSSDVITLDATAVIEDLVTGEIEEYTLTLPEHADTDAQRISVLAPVGTALIGCRVGNIVKWPTPGGIREMKIRQVTRPVSAEPATAELPLFAALTS